MTIDEKAEVLRVSGATALVTVYGLTLNEWVAAITIFYLLAQIVILAPKAYAVIAGLVKHFKGK